MATVSNYTTMLEALQASLILLPLLLYAYLWANQRVQAAAAAPPTRQPRRPATGRKMKRESFARLPQTAQEVRVILVGRKW